MEEIEVLERRIRQIEKIIESTESSLGKIRSLLDQMRKDQVKELYKDVEGIEGYFDGSFMIADDGTNYEVPGNYAAKSRIVYGDRLKLIDEGGKQIFKQIVKVGRKKVDGVLSKKEGKWYILTDLGSFRVSDTAAEFNNAQLNDEGVAIIPADNKNAPFAALDRVKKKFKPKPKPVEKPKAPKKKAPKKKPPTKKKEKVSEISKETPPAKTSTILDEDDLR